MILQCKLTRTAASNRQTWCAILEFFSTTHCQWPCNHISTVTKSCFFHLRRIRKIKRCLNEKCQRTLVQALVISKFDYCNSILINLPDNTLHPYTTLLHSAARLVKIKLEAKGSHYPQHFGNYTGFPSKREFHSKSVSSCSTSIPGHVRVTCHHWSTGHKSRIEESPLICQRRLYVTQRTSSSFGRRTFAVAGPSEWNNLYLSPSVTRHLSDHSKQN